MKRIAGRRTHLDVLGEKEMEGYIVLSWMDCEADRRKKTRMWTGDWTRPGRILAMGPCILLSEAY